MSFMNKVLIFVLSVFCVPMIASASIVIDDFNSGNVDLAVDSLNPTASQPETGLSGVIGGARYSQLDYISGLDMIEMSINQSGGALFSLAYDDDTTYGTSLLRYGSLSTPLAVDLASYGDAFHVIVKTAEYDATLKVTVWTPSGSYDATTIIPAGIVTDTDIAIAFASFAGADFSNVSQIEFLLSGTPMGDYLIQEIIVPEPFTLAMMGVGSLMLARRKLSRQPTIK